MQNGSFQSVIIYIVFTGLLLLMCLQNFNVVAGRGEPHFIYFNDNK